MKIWRSYGSEHSANHVLIGHFQDSGTAEATAALIEELHAALGPSDSGNEGPVRFPADVMKILERVKFTSLAPQEVDHFRWGYHPEVEGTKVIITTDESELSGIIRLFVHKGAKVEFYSAHHYPDSEHGRGKG